MRVLWELWAAGLTDPELAAGWRDAVGGWRDLLESRLRRLGRGRSTSSCRSARARSPRSSRNMFLGIEVELLAGVSRRPHREVLDAVGALIERAE